MIIPTAQQSNKRVSLFCIPFAGGSSYSYKDIRNHTAGFIDIVTLELPGRGRRFGDALLTDLHSLADDALRQIRSSLDRPYAFYGHSMGACLGYLLARRLIREGFVPPLHLFVSGREGPSAQARYKDRHLLPQKEFFDILANYQGTNGEALQNRELMGLFEPVLRADFQAIDSYLYEETAPFDVPVTVMIGMEETISHEDALLWQKETAKKISVREFPGGHFFIFSHLAELGAIFSESLSQHVL